MAPSFCQQLRAVTNARFLLIVGCLLFCTTTFVVNGAPFFTGQDLQAAEFDPNMIYRLYYFNQVPRNVDSKRDKKYERNCFFSPVQCMLSYNANSNDMIYHQDG